VPKVLVADDNNNIQKMVALALEERGIQVTSVGNGEAAVRRVPDLSPDLILADIFMPVRNGYEVCEFVKKDQRFSQIPVVLLIGAFDPLDEKEARRVGADGVLKKPFVPPDPLIAMVLSILEKNPKAAEELKKFKEAKEAPEPHPAFESEAAGKSAFAHAPVIPTKIEPKPLPDFPEPSPEEAALIYGFGKGRRTIDDDGQNGNAGNEEPPAPRGEVDEAAEDEFDGSSTAHDWRRSAMDFDIPADAANQPAFATESFDASMFPSERDVPSQRVNFGKPEEQSSEQVAAREPVIEAETETPSFNARVSPAPVEVLGEKPAPISDRSTEWPSAEPTPLIPISTELLESKKETQPSFNEVPVVASDSPHAPGPPQKTPHWMDLVAKPTERRPSEWMSRISQPPADYPEIASHELSPAELPKPEGAEMAPPPESAKEDTFFADETAQPAPSFFATLPTIQAPVFQNESEPAGVSSNADQDFEKDQDTGASPLFKDPALVEPPAVRVTPEPLLVEEETRESAGYAIHKQEETQPLYSFLKPGAEAEETPETAHAQTQSVEPAATEFSERVPTMPPPTREALAQIPFLTPPADFDPNAKDSGPNESEIVDTLVQKVMERLGPQLHVLLSQDVLKPLVENLLQKELTKKEK
jgi:CheY-like chemotaxis protein